MDNCRIWVRIPAGERYIFLFSTASSSAPTQCALKIYFSSKGGRIIKCLRVRASTSPYVIIQRRAERIGITAKLYDRIWEVFGSNLGQDIGNLDWGFSWFFLVSQANYPLVPPWGYDCFLPNPSQLVIRLSFHHSAPYCLDVDSVVKLSL
jgi:hypothetical protein